MLSPNGILFKVALDPNSLFLAIKLHFFLSVTVFFRFFFFFSSGEGFVMGALQTDAEIGYTGEKLVHGEISVVILYRKVKKALQTCSQCNRPTLGTCISESKAGSHLWLRQIPSLPAKGCSAASVKTPAAGP